MRPKNTLSSLTETRTVIVYLYGTLETDFETAMEMIEDGLLRFDESGTVLDWSIEVEA